MGFKKTDFIDCVGSVNILLDDRVVLQGQIIKDNEEPRKTEICPEINVEVENQNEFITLELSCDALIIRDNGELKKISPTLFQECDRVRVNVSAISAIGPSHGCPDEEKEDEHKCWS